MFGNDAFDLAVARMLPWREVLGPADMMLVGMDARGGRQEMTEMYHDDGGVWERFIRNGLQQSNTLLGAPWYRDEDWLLQGVIKENPPHHKFALVAAADVKCPAVGLHVGKGEVIEFFESWKYGPDIMKMQFEKAGMVQKGSWAAPAGKFCQYILLSAPVVPLKTNCCISVQYLVSFSSKADQ
jgi:uncharacterized SAM-dependent methyltransferase